MEGPVNNKEVESNTESQVDNEQPQVPDAVEAAAAEESSNPTSHRQLSVEDSMELDIDDSAVELQQIASALPPTDEFSQAPPSAVVNAALAPPPIPQAERAATGQLFEPQPLEQQLASPSAVEAAIAGAKHQDWERIASDLVHRVKTADDRGLAAQLAYELGELYERKLADEPRAVQAYSRALKFDPSHRANLWAIRRIFIARELWPNLLKLIDAELRFAQTVEERSDLLLEKARVHLDRIGDVAQARDAFLQACEATPTSLGAHLGLERVALLLKDDILWREALEGLVEASASPERKALYCIDLGRHWLRRHASQADDSDCIESAWLAVSKAFELQLRGPIGEAVCRETHRVAEMRGDAEAMLAIIETHISLLADEFGPASPQAAPLDPESEQAERCRRRIAAFRRRQGRIARTQLQDAERAWNYLEQGLVLLGNESLLLADLAELAEELGKYSELAELCQGWESTATDPKQTLDLSLRRADALLRGGQREQATQLLEKLAAGKPAYLPLFALRERAALASLDWQALATAWREAGESQLFGAGADAEEHASAGAECAAAFFVQAAEVCHYFLGDFAGAEGLYHRALELDPDYYPAVDGLLLLLQNADRRDDYVERIRDELGRLATQLATADEADPLLRSRQSRWMQELLYAYIDCADYERARKLFADFVEIRPQSSFYGWLSVFGLEAVEDWAAAIDGLERIAERDGSLILRAGAYAIAAQRCLEKLQDHGRAKQLFRKALELDPSDPITTGAFVQLLWSEGDWLELVEVRKHAADQLKTHDARTQALREAAFVLLHHLDDAVAAAELLERVTAADPDDESSWVALISACERDGPPARLAEVLARWVEHCGEQVSELWLLRLGAAYERIEEFSKALGAYKRAAEMHPESIYAVIAGAAVSRRACQSTAEQIEWLQRLAEVVDDRKYRARIIQEYGWLYTATPDSATQADDAFAQTLQEDSSEVGAIFGRLLVHARSGNLAGVAESLTALAECFHDAHTASGLLLRAATITHYIDNPVAAESLAQRAVAIAPDDLRTVIIASEQLPAPGTPATAGQLGHYASVAGMRALSSSDPEARCDWELEQAHLLAQAGRTADAGGLVVGVLRDHPQDVRALLLLRTLCRDSGDVEGEARALLQLADSLGDADSKLAMLRQAKELLRERDDQLYCVTLENILKVDIGSAEFFDLVAFLRSHDAEEKLVHWLSLRVDWLGPDSAGDEAQAHIFELAGLFQGLGERDRAIAHLETVLAMSPTHHEAAEFLADLLVDLGEPQRASRLLRTALDGVDEQEAVTRIERKLSRVLAEELDDVDGAIAELQRVVALEPGDIASLERLSTLFTRAERWLEQTDCLEKLADQRTTNAEKAREFVRAGQVLRDRLAGDQTAHARAIKNFRSANRLLPTDVDIVRQLGELYGSQSESAQTLFRDTAEQVRRQIAEQPTTLSFYSDLAELAKWSEQPVSECMALGVMSALGAANEHQKTRLEQMTARLGITNGPLRGTLGQDHWRRLIPTSANMPWSDAWPLIAGGADKFIGLNAEKLGFSKMHRRSLKQVSKAFPFTAATLRSYGLRDVELYVSDTKAGYARVLGAAKPQLYLSSDVAAGDTGKDRFLLGRALAHAYLGTAALADLHNEELSRLCASAGLIAQANMRGFVDDAGLDYDAIEKESQQLSRALARRERKGLAQHRDAFRLSIADLAAWRKACFAAAARAGMLLSGALYAALDVLDVGVGGREIGSDPVAQDLVAWCVGDDYAQLRALLYGGGDVGK